MPKMNVNRSILIASPIENVFEVLTNFNKWSAWSPWNIMEPEVKMTVAPDAKSYEWSGKRTGSGNMKITDSEVNKWANMDLNFLTPYKSSAKVRFEVKQAGAEVQVNWIMDSSLPFFMFFLKKMMEIMIGMDFDRGLTMLKEYVEEGTVSSKLDFISESSFSGVTYVGIRSITTVAGVAQDMSRDFGKLGEYIHQHPDNFTGPMFSQYHKFDFVKNVVNYTAAFGVKSVPADLPEGFVTGTLPAATFYTIRHTGPYKYLGNPWTTASMMVRNKEIKARKGYHPLEVYINNPSDTPDKELVTDICFALKN